MSKEPKINFTCDPRSEEAGTEKDQQLKAFAKELDALCRKHNYPTYLVTVSSEETLKGKRALFSTAVATLDEEMATHLVADAIRAVRNLIAYLKPTAPGGVS